MTTLGLRSVLGGAGLLCGVGLALALGASVQGEVSGPAKCPELAHVLGLMSVLAESSPRSPQPFAVRVFAAPVAVGECWGSPESCPDIRLLFTVATGDLGDPPSLFELPSAKGWEFVSWVTTARQGTSFVLRTTLPVANVDEELRRAWPLLEYAVRADPNGYTVEVQRLQQEP